MVVYLAVVLPSMFFIVSRTDTAITNCLLYVSHNILEDMCILFVISTIEIFRRKVSDCVEEMVPIVNEGIDK